MVWPGWRSRARVMVEVDGERDVEAVDVVVVGSACGGGAVCCVAGVVGVNCVVFVVVVVAE